ncbi:TPA: AAA family ATPase [Listeria monocytogenes]|uniref:ATP-binding protein n=3 Tax=Listeria monocytogenes TaxID=1639 RepID=UPI0004D401E3|nr:ATP-binding protein [Listeria monocytogenes]EAF4465829.1 DNA recombination protein RecN [Listeria monocytogenes serotype 1/2a]EAC2274161.1 DNA recombination protein RecN [Listeria monocytogenes]EAC2369527.1 DNA recombination protein RecN [Listeria monocytogenes]EAC3751721.1 DNA recombination protein RecN [Listeria monocytogenes]EAC3797745.1 DNA recombination protein RecN [Listeria monocytogenes]
MKLFLKTFRMIGIDKNYGFNFKKGLNFISGPTSTGKTTIFELIDYALGAKQHKSYIEVGQKCTDIELEIILDNTTYKIKRRLFDYKLPVLIEILDEANQKFLEYGIFDVENSNNEKSLSSFLLSKLGLSGVKIASQNLSFRDLFKYSYLKQIEIDNEDILSSESNPVLNNKRKSTFEIIFNFYDQLLGELKAKLKESQEELKNETLRYEGIETFLKTSNIENFESVKLRRNEINQQIIELKELLGDKSNHKSEGISNPKVQELNASVRLKKINLKKYYDELNDKDEYIGKLRLLSNQYESDIAKLDATIMGIKGINKYEFLICPNCMKPLETHQNGANCHLCGDNMDDIVENTLILKTEKKNTVKKRNELEKHISYKVTEKFELQKVIKNLNDDINSDERILEELTEEYVNPFIEEISLINMALGRYYKELDGLENSLRFIKELNRLTLLLSDKEKEVNRLKEQIKGKANLNDKSSTLDMLSTRFSSILKEFQFPKLEKAYVNPKDYLPYVRERKYNSLGSLGAVTLITMAYYLSIFVETEEDIYNHLNLLMIDTPRKNLGTSSQNEEFQDEEIYNSVIKYFISLDKTSSEEMQLLIINNGYPDFLPKKDIIVEFSSDGRVGLIDDI